MSGRIYSSMYSTDTEVSPMRSGVNEDICESVAFGIKPELKRSTKPSIRYFEGFNKTILSLFVTAAIIGSHG